MGKQIEMEFDKKEATPESIIRRASEVMNQLQKMNKSGIGTRIALKNYTYTTKVGEVEIKVNGAGLTCDAVEEAFCRAVYKWEHRTK